MNDRPAVTPEKKENSFAIILHDILTVNPAVDPNLSEPTENTVRNILTLVELLKKNAQETRYQTRIIKVKQRGPIRL